MTVYGDLILDHWRRPRNKGRLDDPDLDGVAANPLCGDVVRLQVKLEDGVAAQVRFDGRGCAISQAAASLLTEMMAGKSRRELGELGDEDLLDSLGGVVKTRLSCALLPLRALRKALAPSAEEGS
ncbi:MAG: iron-sulfur cluster assembly scaffold protein [Candidatus Bipolaricaulaceae bacterium]